ncbi:hypothetical protein CEXT_294211 [Caerostris extrusa]|uniref:Uncharacterized protein n=1 Tax=Caerostris extrusa TaxID=172846 RepID=A0AAV4S612_CAEEX|nr:hypothetical protein CEXT_294211 [Caerostris extrusa]
MHRSARIRHRRLNGLLPSNTPFQIVEGGLSVFGIDRLMTQAKWSVSRAKGEGLGRLFADLLIPMHRSAWIRRRRLNGLLPSNPPHPPLQIVGVFVCVLYQPISDTSEMVCFQGKGVKMVCFQGRE